MSGWLFLRNFNKQKINNHSQRNYINLLVVLTIKIAKATDYLACYLNAKHYCCMDNKAGNNFPLIRQNNVNEAG